MNYHVSEIELEAYGRVILEECYGVIRLQNLPEESKLCLITALERHFKTQTEGDGDAQR